MLCELCGQKAANVLFTQIVGQEKHVHHLCRRCAEQKSETSVGVTLSVTAQPMPEVARTQNLSCPDCGLTFAQFQKGGLFGCPACYEAFEPRLDGIFKRIHGAAQYDVAEEADDESAERLRNRLKEAVDVEDYEEAARLRDRLLTLNEKGKSGDF